MATYPTGTVTFLLTDIEGSTTLWEQHPEAMPAAMARHDGIIDRAVAAHRGLVIRPRGEGDSRFVVFQAAGDAIRAAAAIQRELAAAFDGHPFPLRVRAGLHTGAADWSDGSDYYGSAVNRCARIRGLAHGGQTLISSAAAELVRDELPPGLDLVEMGTHRLKGLVRPETVYQLWLPGLPNDFPPLQSAEAAPGNLPTPPTELIGRQRELPDIIRLLSSDGVRLVTLTGPGGTGKTRLSLEVGHELSERFPDGIYFIDLAPISDPGLVPSTIAHTLGLREGGGRPLLENLKDYLADKAMLLILDNLEQVIAVAPFIAQLLAIGPKLKLLATSRVPLRIRAEREYPLPTLPVPPASANLTPAQLLEYESVCLFVRKAQAARPSFELTPENAEAVVAICRRLDGLPLALEIAAARIRLFTPAALLSRLDSSMKVLVGGAADLPERQQTVRNAIDWSYDLLPPPEQTLFARLGVFVGGFTLDDVASVCDSDGDLDLYSGIEALLLNSLIRQVDSAGDEPRFDMLLTIRDYALEKLEASGELPAVRFAHAAHFATRAMEQYPLLYSPRALETMAVIEQEHDNYRAAITWGLEPENDTLVAAQIVMFLFWFWYRQGYLHEGRAWGERLIHATEGQEGFPRAVSFNMAGMMATWQGDLDFAARYCAEAVRIVEQTDFELGIANAHFTYGVTLINQGHDHAAYNHLTQAAELFDQMDGRWDKCNVMIHLGNTSLGLGQPARAQAWLQDAWPIIQELGDPWQVAFCLNNFGEVARVQGDYDRAREFYERSETIYREGDALGDHARLIHTLGYMALHDSDPRRAEGLFRESLAAFQRLGNKRGMIECVCGLAAVAAGGEDAARAATLLSAAMAQMASSGAAWWPADRVEIGRIQRVLSAAMGEAELAECRERGRGLRLEEAIALAVGA